MKRSDDPKGAHKLVFPTIVNIAEIRETLKATTTLLHFTEVQWDHIFKGFETTDTFDDKQMALEVVHMPGRQGEMLASLAAFGPCPPDCTPAYIYEEGRGSFGQRTIDQILIGCDCSHLSLPPPPGPCHLAFVRTTSGTAGTVHIDHYQLLCVDNATGKACTDYVIGWWRNPQGGGYAYCRHR